MKLKKLSTAGMVTAAVCVLAPISFPLPFIEISFSLGVFAVFLCGALLEPLYAAASMAVYILLGIAGLPVFLGYKSGIGVIAGPTGGFLMAYPLMALLISGIIKLSGKKSIPVIFSGMLLSLIICYAAGAAGYALYGKISFGEAFLAAGLPFLPFDAAKAAICSVAASKALKLRLRR